MIIRRAEERDISDILRLLVQVNQVHADGRPDLFKGGGTKYTHDSLVKKLANPEECIYVAVNDDGQVLGYTFCVIEITPETNNTYPHKSFYIDDLCVDENARRQHVGQALYENVKAEAGRLGCDRILLHVWECNPGAHRFYESMGLKPMYYAMEENL